jgi:hypothetical protein
MAVRGLTLASVLFTALFVGGVAVAGDGPNPMNADPPPVEDGHGSAVISNGTVSLGVNDLGSLNFSGVGLRYEPTGGEVLNVGCLCEGWGAADAITGVQGWTDLAVGTSNVVPVSFANTASSATSVTTVGGILQLTHDFQPSAATPNLYEITVTINNISSASVDLRYTREMDWDVPPTSFDEFVTIQGTAAEPTVLHADNNGFQTPGPLVPRVNLGATGDFVDVGPFDHGALFDLGLGALAPGATKSFTIFYGAAGTEVDALAAIAAVGATVYSLGQPNVPGGPDLGSPNTFIFAYQPVMEVDVDIKPFDDANTIRLTTSKKGVIPVAILSTATFDATTVDPSTVCFGDAGAPGERACTETHGRGHIEDPNGDGMLDLVLHYETRHVGIDVGDTQACLTGQTFGGQPIEGCDSVVVLTK